MKDKRFIEDFFPVREVSIEGAREKNIRHGHISTLHIWWARRPLATSRATAYAALIPAEEDKVKRDRIRDFIVSFSKWENSNDPSMIQRARRDILKANNGIPPKVLDPFGGGGAIPLEALRLGCETYSNDYNPVAVLIQKCTLEYPQKYGKPGEIIVEDEDGKLTKRKVDNMLLEDVKRWGEWVLDEAKKEIGKFYPEDEDGSIPVGYIWARTIPCQNPSCGAEIPLMRQFWLAKKSNKKVSLYPYVEDKTVEFKIVGDGYEDFPEGFIPSNGTVSRAVVTCPVCGNTIEANTTRELFQSGKSGQRLIAVVLHKPGTSGKRYRIATDKDREAFLKAEEYLKIKREKLMNEWGMDPIPNEEIPLMSGTFNVPIYGIKKWGELFNSRQKLALITFTEKVENAYNEMLKEGYEGDYAKSVVSYLGLGVNRLADYNSSLTLWAVAGEFIAHTFGRQALPLVWDYFELNAWSNATGDWNSAMGWVLNVISHLSQIPTLEIGGKKVVPTVKQSSATSLPYPDNYFDAVFTDPPYYNSVPYADLSDFFYVWLKRSVGYLYPELFSTPLSPKSQEITEMASWDKERYAYKDKQFFEDMLKKAFKEIQRVLKPDGISIIVYAHKSTSGWETVINALLESGLLITASYPLSTEMATRLRASDSAALASSIYIVARKVKREGIGYYNEVKNELKNYLSQKMKSLWEAGLSGANLYIALIGAGIEVFGKYEKVMDFSGQEIKADRLLKDVREISSNLIIQELLHEDFSQKISNLTRFYLLWRWTFGEAKAKFDDARQIAMSVGVDLGVEWNKGGFIKKEKDLISVLGPQKRKETELEYSSEVIDVLHYTLLLWSRGEKGRIEEVLKEKVSDKLELFFKVAQAISFFLPQESGEKKLIDGFLSGKENIINGVEKKRERKLFDGR